jgi:hypothetical protein
MMMFDPNRIATKASLLKRATIVTAGAMAMLAVTTPVTEAQTSLPEVIVRSPQQPPKIKDQLDHKDVDDGKAGAGAKSGDNKALDRLNDQLKRKVDETNPVGNNPPLDARSPDTKTGVVNIPGVQQQYGQNFGHSVVPFRPEQPVFTSPVGPHH